MYQTTDEKKKYKWTTQQCLCFTFVKLTSGDESIISQAAFTNFTSEYTRTYLNPVAYPSYSTKLGDLNLFSPSTNLVNIYLPITSQKFYRDKKR